MTDKLLEALSNGMTTTNAEATRELGRKLAAVLPVDSVLALRGELGTGKTTLVSGIAAGLGIEQPVTSPTYNYFNLYRAKGRQLVHLDAYRLETEAQADSLMLEDMLISPWLLVVEWPERFAPSWFKKAPTLQITVAGEQARHFQLEA
ncbi:MAG: tRNA (adenosine(37)-N6)-threonylcarbamoyltransferase complex ATPase subunit type 1 TsaE [Verrucomicrobiota bacterium]